MLPRRRWRRTGWLLRRPPRNASPTRYLHAKSALEGERKQVSVLFADVKGSMELAEQMDPEAWSAIMQRFFAILAEGVERFEGFVDKFTGDGIMALFGAPIAHEDHAQRACFAALYLRDELKRYARRLGPGRASQGIARARRAGSGGTGSSYGGYGREDAALPVRRGAGESCGRPYPEPPRRCGGSGAHRAGASPRPGADRRNRRLRLPARGARMPRSRGAAARRRTDAPAARHEIAEARRLYTEMGSTAQTERLAKEMDGYA